MTTTPLSPAEQRERTPASAKIADGWVGWAGTDTATLIAKAIRALPIKGEKQE